MKYWWVNQKSTFKQESSGGYMWSPQKNKNENQSHYYDNMCRISVGDIVLSFEHSHISAVSIVTKSAVDAVKPKEFGAIGDAWDNKGWKIELQYHFLCNRIRLKDYIDQIRVFLPNKYSPLQSNGNGNQAYLFELTEELFNEIASIIGIEEINSITKENSKIALIEDEEKAIEKSLLNDKDISQTTIEQLIKARKGQGIFKANVEKIEVEFGCRVTGVKYRCHLIASHIKPWRVSNNQERLDGNNGLLLSPHIDHLFDRGYISFSNEGYLLLSSMLDAQVIKLWSLSKKNVGKFNAQQKIYLEYHRNNIFHK